MRPTHAIDQTQWMFYGASALLTLCAALGCLPVDTGEEPEYNSEFDSPPPDRSNNNDGNSSSGDCSPACSIGQTCRAGRCESDRTGPRAGSTGASCDQDAQCDDGTCLIGDGIPDGYCSKVCATGQVGDDDMCAQDALCMSLESGTSICVDQCQAQNECRQGYNCITVGQNQGACLPGCTSDDQCELGNVCDLTQNLCVEDASGSRLGSACLSGDQCDSGFCVTQADSGWPGGACIGDCTGRSTGDFCDGQDPSSGVCLEIDATFSGCFPSCTASGECRVGYICSTESGFTNSSGYGLCIPSCDVTGCDAGQYCDVSGACQEETFGTDQQLTSQVLGSVALDDTHISLIEFTIPENTLSFALTVEAVNSLDREVDIIGLVAPSGEYIYAYDDPINGLMKYNRSFSSVRAIGYPNAPSLRVVPGDYGVDLYSPQGGEFEVTLHLKTGASPRQGRFPLTFWFANNPYFDAATARNDPGFQQAVEQMKQIYASAGIEIAPIEYRDAAEPAASLHSVFTYGDTPLATVLAELIGDAPPQGFHMVLNDQALASGGGALYGISGGLPGPVGVNQAPTLGVLVGMDLHVLESGALNVSELGSTMGHELGHYLGLFHISERDGLAHDPLDDTPQCLDADGDGLVSGAECSPDGGSNMMYWTTDLDFTHNQLSPAQKWVLMRNPGVLH